MIIAQFAKVQNLVARSVGIFVATLAILFYLVTPAKAVELNICEKLVEDLFIPGIEKVTKCKCPKFLGVPYMPHCCIPVTCKLSPECTFVEIVETAEGYWKHKGDIHCELRDITSEEFVEKWLRDEIANIADILAAGLPRTIIETLGSHADTIAARGNSIPAHVRSLVGEMIAPVYDYGDTGFAYSDIDNTKIISESVDDASWYLRGDYGGVTLGPVVVFKDDLYRQIMDPNNTFTLDDIQNGYASGKYINAIQVLVHELVHVKQFRVHGRQTFQMNYVAEYLVYGYGRDSFENEAYTYSANISILHGGIYCEKTEDLHTQFIVKFDLSVDYVCNPYWKHVRIASMLVPFLGLLL